jgi:PAS domain S-box-containing protein
VVIHIFDPSGRTLMVNPALTQTFGLPAEALHGYNIFDDPRCRRRRARELLGRMFRGEVVRTPPLRHDASISAGQGQARWVETLGFPVRDEAGALREVVLLTQDITAAHETQEALRRSEERFRTALEIETVGAIYFDLEGRLTDANDAFLRKSGYGRADIEAGRLSLHGLTPPERQAEVERTLAELKAKGQTTPEEKQYIRPDGSRWWALCASKLLPDGTGLSSCSTSPTGKAAEARLLEETRTLETLNRTGAAVAGELGLERLFQQITDAGVNSRARSSAPTSTTRWTRPASGCTCSPCRAPSGRRSSGWDAARHGRVRADLPQRRRDPLGRHPGRSRAMASSSLIAACPRGTCRSAATWPCRWSRARARCWEVCCSATRARPLHRAPRAAHRGPRGAGGHRHRQRAPVPGRCRAPTRRWRRASPNGRPSSRRRTRRSGRRRRWKPWASSRAASRTTSTTSWPGISGSLEAIERRLAQGRLEGLDRFIKGAQSSSQRAAALTQRLLAFARRQTLDPKPTDVNRLVFGMEELIRRTVGPDIEVEVVGAGGCG